MKRLAGPMMAVMAAVWLGGGCGQDYTPDLKPDANADESALGAFDAGGVFAPNGRDGARIEAAIRREVDKPEGPLTQTDLDQVTQLNLARQELKDIGPLKHLPNLQRLALNNNEVASLKPLSGLRRLTQLDLSANGLTRLDGLERMTQLEELFLKDNRIADLSALAGLVRLNKMILFVNRVTDACALAELHALEFLYLDYNTLPDISALANLKSLAVLGLDGSRVKDISALAKIKGLKRLYISFNPELTKAEIADLQKALPDCDIRHNAKR